MMKIINHIGNKLDLPVRETLSISPYDENTIPAVSEEICADLMNRYSLISENYIADDVLVVSFFAESTYKFSVFSALLQIICMISENYWK